VQRSFFFFSCFFSFRLLFFFFFFFFFFPFFPSFSQRIPVRSVRLGVLGRAVTAKVSTNSLNLFERFSEPAIFPERVIEGCCSIKWKNLLFHRLLPPPSLPPSLSPSPPPPPSLSRPFIKRRHILVDFPGSGFRCFSDFCAVLLIASINSESSAGDRYCCQMQRHRNSPASLPIPRVSRLSLHIPLYIHYIFSASRDSDARARARAPTGFDCLFAR